MSYASAASVLSDREIYRDFHRTLPSFNLSAVTMATLMREFGWQQMAIITQEESVFTEVGNQILYDLYNNYYNQCFDYV